MHEDESDRLSGAAEDTPVNRLRHGAWVIREGAPCAACEAEKQNTALKGGDA